MTHSVACPRPQYTIEDYSNEDDAEEDQNVQPVFLFPYQSKENGQVQAAGKDPAAEKWAQLMTDRYDALGKEDPVFTELRNVMDMCVAAAVIRNHNLQQAAQLELPHLLGEQGSLATEAWHTPREVSTQTSFIKTSRGLTITASGGVDIDYLSPTQNPTLSPEVRKVWEKAESLYSAGQWWN